MLCMRLTVVQLLRLNDINAQISVQRLLGLLWLMQFEVWLVPEASLNLNQFVGLVDLLLKYLGSLNDDQNEVLD